MNLLVVASNILHYFHFDVPNGEEKPSLDSEPGGVRYPKDFLLVAKKRD
jgi:hypothetical protein